MGGAWSVVADYFKDDDNILGYELINEPWAGDIYADPGLLLPTTAAIKNLQPAYDHLNKAIRAKDNQHRYCSMSYVHCIRSESAHFFCIHAVSTSRVSHGKDTVVGLSTSLGEKPTGTAACFPTTSIHHPMWGNGHALYCTPTCIVEYVVCGRVCYNVLLCVFRLHHIKLSLPGEMTCSDCAVRVFSQNLTFHWPYLPSHCFTTLWKRLTFFYRCGSSLYVFHVRPQCKSAVS